MSDQHNETELDFIEHFERIKSYLAEYDWKYELIESDTILTGFRGDEFDFTMFMHYSDNTLFMSIPNLSDPPLKLCKEQYYQYLLHANYHMTLAKFSMDEFEKPVLTIELPIDLITRDLFIYALFLLASNANDHISFVKDVTTNPEFQNPYLQL